MSDWVKDGQRVMGTYRSRTVTGTVITSRVKYGGTVQYTVQLDNEYGGDTVLMSRDSLDQP